MHLVAVVVSLLVPLSRRAALHTAKQKTRTALHAARQAAHPLLDGAEALRVRRDGAAFFAQVMPRVWASDWLAESASNPKAQLRAGDALLRRMNAGTQRLEDFDDGDALRGYFRRIFSDRAFQILELCAVAHRSSRITEALDATAAKRRPRVATLGGGPASCLAGYVGFERIVLHRACDADAANVEPTDDRDAEARLFVLDYSAAWVGAVRSVEAALGERVAFETFDLSQPLGADCNAALAKLAPTLDVVLYSRTLSEVDADRAAALPAWAQLFLDVWAALPPGAVVVVKDEAWLEKRVVQVLEEAGGFEDGSEWWTPPGGVHGLFLRKSYCDAPS